MPVATPTKCPILRHAVRHESHTRVGPLGVATGSFFPAGRLNNPAGTMIHKSRSGSFTGLRFEPRISPRSRPPEPNRPAPAAASVSPNTRDTDARALRQFDAWRDHQAITDATLVGYLAALYAAGRTPSSATASPTTRSRPVIARPASSLAFVATAPASLHAHPTMTGRSLSSSTPRLPRRSFGCRRRTARCQHAPLRRSAGWRGPRYSEAARSRRGWRFPAASGFGRSASTCESGTGNP